MTVGYANPIQTISEILDTSIASSEVLNTFLPQHETIDYEAMVAFYRQFHAVRPGGTQDNIVQGLLEALKTNQMSDAGPSMQHGLWEHFKGGRYLSVNTARWAEDGATLVVYWALANGTLHARRADEWNELTMWPDGKYRSRFIPLRE